MLYFGICCVHSYLLYLFWTEKINLSGQIYWFNLVVNILIAIVLWGGLILGKRKRREIVKKLRS